MLLIIHLSNTIYINTLYTRFKTKSSTFDCYFHFNTKFKNYTSVSYNNIIRNISTDIRDKKAFLDIPFDITKYRV